MNTSLNINYFNMKFYECLYSYRLKNMALQLSNGSVSFERSSFELNLIKLLQSVNNIRILYNITNGIKS